MMKIVADGSIDMPEGWAKKYKIHVLPISIQFGNETFIQGEDMDNDLFYRMVKERGIIPKTSLPSPQKILDFYRNIAEKGDTILSLHIGSRMSGTFSTVQSASRELMDTYNIHVFDSGGGLSHAGVHV